MYSVLAEVHGKEDQIIIPQANASVLQVFIITMQQLISTGVMQITGHSDSIHFFVFILHLGK